MSEDCTHSIFYDDQTAEIHDVERAREFHRYLHPVNLSSIEERRNDNVFDFEDVPRLSEALAPLCQLTALQCRVKKAMINCMDRDTMYFLTEATASRTRIEGELHQFIQDPILASCTSVPLKGRICELTIRLTDKPDKRLPTFVVPDLTKSRFAGMSIISGPPFYRFYAGMPIRTKSGLNIGSLAIMDDQPRKGLTLAEEDFMRITVTQIMTLLETNRQAIENVKMRKMMSGLTNFVSSSRSEQQESQTSRGSSSRNASSNTRHEYGMAIQALEKDEKLQASGLGIPSSSHLLRKAIDAQNPGRPQSHLHPSGDSEQSIPRDVDLDIIAANATKALLQRAAIAIRESLSLSTSSPVIFFRTNNLLIRDLPSNAIVMSPDNALDLSSLITSKDGVNTEYMCRLSNLFPGGKIWTLDSKSCSKTKPDARAKHHTNAQTPSSSDDPSEFFRAAFDSPRQVVFMPITNTNFSRPPFCLLIPSHDEERTFNVKADLSFLHVFCSTISTAITKIEAQRLHRQKNDFVGNISHEMRSPLHGILSSVHFLSDSNLSDFQRTMLDTIEKCSETLLDTVNHILDYSKINTFEKQWSTIGRDGDSKHPKSMHNENDPNGPPATSPSLMHLQAVTDISAVLEQVVDQLVLSHIYHRDIDITDLSREARAKAILDQPRRRSLTPHFVVDCPEIILDIEKTDWCFTTQPGAIRRVFSNLVGNALKYTLRGHIKVSLTQVALQDHCPHGSIILTVEDTGVGMSRDFLESEVYVPFSQENHLSPGTGLGLSIVHSIVRMMGGTIEFKSSVGEGTTVKVCLPLPRHLDGQELAHQTPRPSPTGSETIQPHTLLPSDLTFCFYNDLRIEPQSFRQIHGYLTEWIGLKASPFRQTAAVIITMAYDLQKFLHVFKEDNMSTSMVIALYEAGSTHQLGKGYDHLPKTKLVIQFVSLPCGPHKLSRAIRRGIGDHAQERASTSEQTPTHQSTLRWMRRIPQQFSDRRKGLDVDFNGADLDSASESYGAGTGIWTEHGISENQTPMFTTSINSGESWMDVPQGFPFPPQESSRSSQLEQVTQPGNLGLSRAQVITKEVARPLPSTDPRVLIVDDNAINLRLLETFLQKRRKYSRITKAMNGREAVDLFTSAALSETGYELVFMDISMPVMNGFEATRNIRAFETSVRPLQTDRKGASMTRRSSTDRGNTSRAGALIIALTGLASGKDQAEGFECGLDVYMTKPVKFDELSRFLDVWQQHRCESDTPG